MVVGLFIIAYIRKYHTVHALTLSSNEDGVVSSI